MYNKKKDIRKDVYKKRNEISAKQFENWNSLIFENVKCFIEEKKMSKIDTIFTYCNYNNEVSTKELFKYMREHGKTVAFPKITDADKRKMSFFETNSYDELVPGYKGIMEPVSNRNMDDYCENAIMFIPMVAYDSNLNRVGYGGGYYDRYIEVNNPAIKIGLAFEFQKYEFQNDEFDKTMDYVITERAIYGGMTND